MRTVIGILMSCVALISCRTDEQRVREIVKEELSGAMERMAMLDAYTVGPYSPAQKVGNFLFVSGQIGINQETGVLEDATIESETRQALDNLMRVLRSSGFDSSEVISTTVYLTDMNEYGAMNSIYGGYFMEGSYPARATVQVAALPRGARVEISAIAAHALRRQ